MKRYPALICVMLWTVFSLCGCQQPEALSTSSTEAFRDSLVYLTVSSYEYEQTQPWRHTDVRQHTAFGTAVGPYHVLTTAWAVRNQTNIKARCTGQNTYVSAAVDRIDYETNLALLTLDANQMNQPLVPVVFEEQYEKEQQVTGYWLGSNQKIYTARGFFDRANVSGISDLRERNLTLVVTNASQSTSDGQLYCLGRIPVGIAYAASGDQVNLAPAAVINAFLADAADGTYHGFGSIGFSVTELLDPAVRNFLGMPNDFDQQGVYINSVYHMGTGSDVLEVNDVILTIDGFAIDSYGNYKDPMYDELFFSHRITSKSPGETVDFEFWRDGKKLTRAVEIKAIDSADMLVPYYEFDTRPQYLITGGLVFQKLSRPYLAAFGGKNWAGNIVPHLVHYFQDRAYKPTEERKDVVVLSYVLPAPINLGYKDLSQIVVKQFNGMAITSIADIREAQKRNPDSAYDVIEFELDQPLVVLPRGQLPTADAMIGQLYGIEQLSHIGE